VKDAEDYCAAFRCLDGNPAGGAADVDLSD
jgi:hypothetical protein